jgi:hypothetical protein
MWQGFANQPTDLWIMLIIKSCPALTGREI